MATNEERLSEQQQEVVALGASVGAGCHPCFNHHVEAATHVALSSARLEAAVANAERVRVAASDDLARHVRDRLGVETLTAGGPDDVDRELAGLGAAIAADDRTGIDRHLRAAIELGVPPAALEQAVTIAATVQTKAAEIHQNAARQLLSDLAPGTQLAPHEDDTDCGCGRTTAQEAGSAQGANQ